MCARWAQVPAAEARFVRLRATREANPLLESERHAAIRWLLGLLLLGITGVSGAFAVVLVGLPQQVPSAGAARRLVLQIVAWLYLAAGVSLALWLLLERRGARYLFGAWLAALALLLAALPRPSGGLEVLFGILCAVVVSGLVAALDWATRADAA